MTTISRRHTLMGVLLGTLACGAFTPAAWGQTAFDYQGQLQDGGVAANGNYNLTFRLFDAAVGGSQVGLDVLKPNTPVTNGLFSTQLDFGVLPWVPNLPRWLEIEVNGQTLSPRLELIAVPSSLNTRGINVDATGQVGIGTAAPAQKLSVVGTVQSTSGGFMFPDGTVQTTAATGGGGFWSANGTHIFKNNSGNVGIGTSAPTESLHLVGNPNRQVVARFDNPGASAGGSWLTTAHTPTGREWSFGVNASDGGFDFFNNFAFINVMRLSASGNMFVQGNVGIGTASPSASLSVVSNTTNAGDNSAVFYAPNIGPSASHIHYGPTGDWFIRSAATTGKVILQDAGGNVGIGTTAPAYPLTIFSTTSQFGGGYGWAHTDGTRQLGSFVNASGGWLGTLSAHPLYFFTANGSAQMTLTTAGNLGIGTTNPQARLHVAGTTRTNVLEITGADLAEKFPTREEKAEPGTVMEIDPDHAGELRIAREAYSTRVAGVVSGAGDLPVGAILGNLPKSENSPAIALSGRVWVRCDASAEPIVPGDLLTTSDTPGHAMKASDRERSHGAVLGKAMSALKKGETALVLVLVNLQ